MGPLIKVCNYKGNFPNCLFMAYQSLVKTSRAVENVVEIFQPTSRFGLEYSRWWTHCDNIGIQ